MRRLSALSTILLLLALAVGVRAQDDEIILGPYVYPEGINPLTGLPVSDPELLNRRPILVKISNYPPEVRPQSGLNSAAIAWEALVEGGVTRFSVIFYGEDVPHVGPVRSARLVDIPLTQIYRALFVHSGSSVGTRDRLRSSAYVALHNLGGGGCPPLCRFPQPGVAYEHTLFGDTSAMVEQFERYNMDTTPEPLFGMAFSETPPAGGTPVNGIAVEFRQALAGWTYDEAGGWWTRETDGEPHYDAYSGAQIRASNVVVLEAEHVDQPTVSEGYWGAANYATQPVLTGSGRIFLFRDGSYYEGEWRRETDADPLTYYDLAGSVLPFKPGNTFVELVPRWFNGYELTFDFPNPPTATVTTNAVTRFGPSPNYYSVDSVAAGTILTLVGRNGAGDWVQVLMPDGETSWISTSVLSFDATIIPRLPRSRSTFEG